MIESAYNPKAYSRSHASGMWQIHSVDGKKLRAAPEFLVRRPARSDRGDQRGARLPGEALRHVRQLGARARRLQLGRRSGEAAPSQRIRRKDCRATTRASRSRRRRRNYIPKLQAVKNIVANPQAYGLRLADIPNRPYFAHRHGRAAHRRQARRAFRAKCRWRNSSF
jgi:membrane-bound lytic murein transglycosylase D